MRGSQLCEVVSRDQRWTHVPGMRIGGVRRNLSPTCASCLAPPLFQLLHLEIGVTRELVPDDILRIRPREIVEHEKRGALKTHNRRNRATSPGSYGMNAAGGVVLRAPSRSVCVLLLQDLLQSCARGGRRRVEDMCYERRRAEACVDESAHHALVNAGGREIV